MTGPGDDGPPGAGLDTERDRRLRLTVVATHPIQYQAPLYRLLADSRVVDLRVVFLTDFGMVASFDPGFGRDVAFDVSLTGGYRHEFLTTGVTRHPKRRFVPPSALWSKLSGRHCDVVLVHGYATVASWAVCAAAMHFGTPYMVRGESRWEADMAHSAGRVWAKHRLVGPLLRRAGACLAIGASNRQFYQSYGVNDDRIVMAPYSVDTERFALEGAEGRARRTEILGAAGLDPSLPTVCFAAKLQPQKRPMDVIAAFRQMTQPANLIVIGDGPLRRLLDEPAAELNRMRVLGFVNQSAIGSWYGVSDVIVLPSETEPWGLVINEAMASGAVPVLSSAVGCAPDLVGRGAVVPVGDVAGLARALDRIVADPVALQLARAESRALSDEYSLAATARGYERATALAGRSL